MYRLLILILLLLCACASNDIQDSIYEEDKQNKLLELEYLEEIKIAQDNNDTEALDFYLQEYFNVPRLEFDEEQKKDKRYFEGGKRIKY
tara:strand:+ start:511 stop:777 length:267 start_codon:yes stop_codon:yes gene_type:complete